MTLLTDAGDRCVTMNTFTSLFEASPDDDNSINFEQKAVSDLEAGQVADAFGENGFDGWQADTVIFEAGEVQIQPLS